VVEFDAGLDPFGLVGGDAGFGEVQEQAGLVVLAEERGGGEFEGELCALEGGEGEGG
jgi:hypothetical protein